MKWSAAVWLSVRTSLGKGFSGSLFIKAISLIWLLLTETFFLAFWTGRSRHPQEGGRFQPLLLLVGYKLGNPFKGFILFLKKSTGVFVWTVSFSVFIYIRYSEGWRCSEITKVYRSGLKIWARAQSFMEIGGFTQPGALGFRLMWGNNKLLLNWKDPGFSTSLRLMSSKAEFWFCLEVFFLSLSEYRMPEGQGEINQY